VEVVATAAVGPVVQTAAGLSAVTMAVAMVVAMLAMEVVVEEEDVVVVDSVAVAVWVVREAATGSVGMVVGPAAVVQVVVEMARAAKEWVAVAAMATAVVDGAVAAVRATVAMATAVAVGRETVVVELVVAAALEPEAVVEAAEGDPEAVAMVMAILDTVVEEVTALVP
jgi:hypothetical protein